MSGPLGGHHCQPILVGGSHERVPNSSYPAVGVDWGERFRSCPGIVAPYNAIGLGKGR